MRKKKERSKVKQTNKAKQHSTPKAVTFPRKKLAASGGTRTHDTLYSRQSALPTELPRQLSWLGPNLTSHSTPDEQANYQLSMKEKAGVMTCTCTTYSNSACMIVLCKQKIDDVKSCTCSRQEVVIVQQMFRIEDLENLILSHHCLRWTYPVTEGGREGGREGGKGGKKGWIHSGGCFVCADEQSSLVTFLCK